MTSVQSLSLWAGVVVTFVVLVVATLMFLAARYKRCPSDQVLVIFGKVGEGQSSRCIHGGGAFIWPLIQDYRYLSLTPMSIFIDLKNALSLQNIRISVPSTFTVGVSTHGSIMNNAAERLLNLTPAQIEEMAREIIFGQLRLTVASLTIEQINQDRESFLESIRKNVEPELNKIGLYLINVNITDITDESSYIESIGKKAASEAVNRARVDVSEQEKIGAIGQSLAQRERLVQVAVNEAEGVKGKSAADAEQRVFVQQQETRASVGESEAVRNRDIGVSQNAAEAMKGKKAAEADQRVFVQQREAEAVLGENTSRANIVRSTAELEVQQAESRRLAQVAVREAEILIQQAQARAERERLLASEIVREEIDRQKVEIEAAAAASQVRLRAQGDADATRLRYEAEAEGVRKVMQSKADGYRALVEGCGGDARSAAALLMIEKLEVVVEAQVAALKHLKIDKVVVWDGGSGSAANGSSTASFAASLIKSLPPLHEVAAMAGIELPDYLGKTSGEPSSPDAGPPTP
ncbi:MAG TPA: SPFH domain-containing protein [Polyangiales bacterium]|nr:SPFH domain-containing protein [Polyangiales bacterium]